MTNHVKDFNHEYFITLPIFLKSKVSLMQALLMHDESEFKIFNKFIECIPVY